MAFKSTKKSLKKVTKRLSKTAKRISNRVANALKKRSPKPVSAKTVTAKKTTPVSDKKGAVNGGNNLPAKKEINTILVAQPKPENDKNPYTEIAARHKVAIHFKPFIHLEGVPLREFRRYRVNPVDYTAVIFTSRNAIDHFFKLCDDLKIKMSQETKYYCMTEAIALYLQKYILYRKRKVFYGDNTLKGLTNEIVRHRDNEKYLLPCADIHKADIADFLKAQKYQYAEVVILRTVPVELAKKDVNYDMIIFFTVAGVNSLIHNFPDYKQRGTAFGAFGPQTAQAIADAGFRIDILAPSPEAPSMSMGIDKFLAANKKK